MSVRWLVRRGRWVRVEHPAPPLVRVPLHWSPHPDAFSDRLLRDHLWRVVRDSGRFDRHVDDLVEEARRLDALWGLPELAAVDAAPSATARLEHEGVQVTVTARRGQVLFTCPVPERVVARPGKGRAGHLILDRYLHTEAVPEEAVGPVLELVHANRGLIDEGVAELTWSKNPLRGLRLLTEAARALAD